MGQPTTPVLLNIWAGGQPADVLKEFAPDRYDDTKVYEFIEGKDRDGVDILFASYTDENYSGEAFVIFRQDGKLFEVHGSHCSCMGLEGQWEPEETTVRSLRDRVCNGKLGREYWDNKSTFANELFAFLGTLPRDV